jgi:hypothetical protein
MLKNAVNNTGFDRDTTNDYDNLCKIADGELFTDPNCYDSGFGLGEKSVYDNLKYTAEVLDNIIDKIIEAYNTKCGIKE